MPSLKKAALVAAALLCAVDARAQRSVTVNYPGGSASSNGYASASVPVQYGFADCDGEIWLIARREGSGLNLARTYWLDGKQEQVPATYTYDGSFTVAFTADVMQPTPQGPKRIASTTISGVSGAGLAGCYGAVDFKRVGKFATLFGKTVPSSERDAIAGTLYLQNVAVARPFSVAYLESLIRSDKMRAERARNDSIAAAASKVRRDSIARADSLARRARQDSIARARAATSTAGATATTRQAGSPTQAAQTAAPSRADSAAAADARRAALAQARADSLQRVLDAQRAEQAARQQQAEAEAVAVTQTVGQLGQITKGTSAQAGFLIMSISADESSASHFGSGTGYGAGILGKWFFVDAGLIKAQFNDYYMQNSATIGTEQEQSGYFMTGGLLLPSPLSVGLGYQTVETVDESDSGPLVTFVGRGKSLAARFDIGAMTWGTTYNFGLYFSF